MTLAALPPLWRAAGLLAVGLALAARFAPGPPYDDPRVLAAFVGVAGAALTAYGSLTLWRAQEAAKREREAAEARARRRKIVYALRAEIALSIETLLYSFDPDLWPKAFERYREEILDPPEDGKSMPVGVAFGDYIVFDTLKPDLAELPEYAIRAVARFFQQDRYLNEMVRAFSDGDYDGLSAERRIAALDEYFDVGHSTLGGAIRARRALDAALAGAEAAPDEAAYRSVARDEDLLRKLVALRDRPRTRRRTRKVRREGGSDA